MEEETQAAEVVRMLEEDPANREWREKYGRLLEEEMLLRIADQIRAFELERPKIA
jgi:hypothetical protein